jgi:ADP-heptose:LPS heptosyltransferase
LQVRRLDFGQLRHIALLRTSSIGDVILGSVCLRVLEECGFQGQVTWIGRAPSLELMGRSRGNLRVIDLPRRLGIGSWRNIVASTRDVDLLIDLQGNLRSRLLGWVLRVVAGAKVARAAKAQRWRAGLLMAAKKRGRAALLPDAACQPLKPQWIMMREALTSGLQRCGCELDLAAVERARPHLGACLPRAEFEALNAASSWIAIAPGAAYPTKQTPLEIVAKVLVTLQHELESARREIPGLLIVGDKTDAARGEELFRLLGWKGPTRSVAGTMSLYETGRLLSACDLLISNDSALGHLAEAWGTPVGVMFGPTIEGFGFAPWRAESRAFSAKVGCRPCSKHGRLECRFGDLACFAELPVARVAAWALERLQERQR